MGEAEAPPRADAGADGDAGVEADSKGEGEPSVEEPMTEGTDDAPFGGVAALVGPGDAAASGEAAAAGDGSRRWTMSGANAASATTARPPTSTPARRLAATGFHEDTDGA